MASLREYVVTGLANASYTYKIKLRVHNHAGYADSPACVVVLAAVPDAPPTAPSSDALITDRAKIKINFGPLLDSQNGGSAVLSYEL